MTSNAGVAFWTGTDTARGGREGQSICVSERCQACDGRLIDTVVSSCSHYDLQAGRLMMRAGLSDLLKIGPGQLQFTRGEKGKPLLVCDRSLSAARVGFNVSHQVSDIASPLMLCSLG